jgi:hypothetical protein
MVNIDKYKSFKKEGFLLDEDFRKMVRASDSAELTVLLSAFPEKREEINMAVIVLRSLHLKPVHEPIERKQELWNKILQEQKIIYSSRFIFSVAASLLLIIGIGSLVFYLNNKNRSTEVIVQKVHNLPSDNDARLILADGKTVSIQSKQSTVRFSADGSGVMINDRPGIEQPISELGFNQMIVPYGKRSSVTLADGTKVWLNSGSKLMFPPLFKGLTREVMLEGEALFEVTKNSAKPFLVKTDAFKLKVYGTKFNVQAYSKEEKCIIVLVEGKISMNSNQNLQSAELFLAPNQKVSISRSENKFEIENIPDTELYTAWIDGYLTFSNEDVKQVLKRVSRYYNISIESHLPGDEKIHGKLDLKDDPERVLDGIALISKTKYKKEQNSYIFYK